MSQDYVLKSSMYVRKLEQDHAELLEAARGVVNILYSTDTNLSGEQERAVERLLWAQMKAEGKA